SSMIRRSKYTVNPSFNQKSFQVLFVTKLPLQLCANSCATNETNDLSPAIIVGVANVKHGFSIPPNGKLGGKTNKSKRPQSYGPYNFSAVSSILCVSTNSYLAASIIDGSA